MFFSFFKYSVLLLSFIFCQFCFAQNHIALTVPKVTIDTEMQHTKAIFTQELNKIAFGINQQLTGPILGIAPLGGSKVTAFKELNLDGLVIIDWDRTGTPDTIQKTFKDASLLKTFKYALEQALNGGSMSSDSVMRTSVSAQILARLWYELGVSSVRIQFYQPKTANRVATIQVWDGPEMTNNDLPLVTRYSFNYHSKPKDIIFISSKTTSDMITDRNSLPMEILRSLSPHGFHWGYLSADGLIFFSKKTKSLDKGNAELLSLLAQGGAVILDYPQHPSYINSCTAYDGLYSMCGRADLENWGLKLIKRLSINKNVFGYTGFDPKDEVRIYVQSSMKKEVFAIKQQTIFATDELSQVGDDYEFEMVK